MRLALAVLFAALACSAAWAAPQGRGDAAGDWLQKCYLPLPHLDGATEVYSDSAAQSYADEIFAGTNEFRAKKKLRALERDPHLDAVAQAHAVDMAARGYFDHRSPQGMDVFDRLECAGCAPLSDGGENIAEGYGTAQLVLNGWLKSPGHKANILGRGYERIGIGAYLDPRSGDWYWVQVFGSYDDDSAHWLEPGQGDAEARSE